MFTAYYWLCCLCTVHTIVLLLQAHVVYALFIHSCNCLSMFILCMHYTVVARVVYVYTQSFCCCSARCALYTQLCCCCSARCVCIHTVALLLQRTLSMHCKQKCVAVTSARGLCIHTLATDEALSMYQPIIGRVLIFIRARDVRKIFPPEFSFMNHFEFKNFSSAQDDFCNFTKSFGKSLKSRVLRFFCEQKIFVSELRAIFFA